MLLVSLTCLLLVVLTISVHYEALKFLNFIVLKVHTLARPKVLLVVLGTFLAHAIEILLYGLAFYVLVGFVSEGMLKEAAQFSLMDCLYFSAETFTSLGFGDIAPIGPVRLLVGAEALNGLLLIGWSASFTYLAMEKFWGNHGNLASPKR